ncbi:MAG: hypothetical protein ABIR79_20455 [Candidatus Binatia bacterium]
MSTSGAADSPLGSWRLPREVETDPRHEEIRAALGRAPRKLWTGGTIDAAVVPFGADLQRALQKSQTTVHLVRGLETAAAALEAEQRGLAALDPEMAGRQGQRVSRLLLITNDGAERFYRQVERLALTHAPRVLACVVECDSQVLGTLLYGEDAVAKLVLTSHKTAAATILRALAGS